MYNHALKNYVCPICVGVAGQENEQTLIRQSDIVYSDERVMVFVGSFFVGGCDGHLIVVPRVHCENIYDLPDDVGGQIFAVAKKMAVAMKRAYGCEGVTLLQNNEPVGGQHAFHYHLHLFPRYKNDRLHESMGDKRLTTTEERLPFVAKIREGLSVS